MAVDVDDIVEVAARQVDAYREAELQLIDLIRRSLDQGMDAPTWADDRLAAIVTLRRAAQAVVKRLATGDPGIRAAVARAYRNGRGGAVLDLPGALGDEARAARAHVPQVAAMDSLASALIRDIGERRRNVLRNVEDVYRRTITAAVARELGTGMTRREASQAAYQGLVDKGISSFTDRAGRTWRLTTYVEMAVRTVSMRAAVQGQTDRLLEMGQTLVIVSDELGECIRCRPWEGKVLSLVGDDGSRAVFGESVTEEADPRNAMTSVVATRDASGELVRTEVAGTLAEAMLAGLLHPNCGHTIRAYLPGATRRPAGPTEDPDTHKAKVRQRAIEREIRKAKERQVAALTPEAEKAAKADIRRWQGVMRDHLKANPRLKRLPYREEIGAGNLPPAGGAPSPAGELHGPPDDTPPDAAAALDPDQLATSYTQQLRDIARYRGLTVPEGASRADIIKLLAAAEPPAGQMPRRVPTAPTRSVMPLAPEDRLAAHLRAVNLLPNGLPDDVRESAAAELAHQSSITPKSALHLRIVDIPEAGSPDEAEWDRKRSERVGAAYTFETASMQLTPNLYRDPDLLRGMFADGVEMGWLVPGHATDVVRLLVAHEWGHHISRVIRWDGPDHRWRGDRIERLWWPIADELGVVRPEVAQNPLTTMTPLVLWMTRPEVHAAIEQQVSRYALDSPEELLAELWAEYSGMGTDARSLQQRVGAIMRDMAEQAADR